MAAKVKEDMQEEKGLNIEQFGKTVSVWSGAALRREGK